ncbi:hypothetical protein ACWC0C_29535 [Streptomyces sp. NPDC001709]
MDPAVIAALITTPTAVLAAATAYLAGRAQGRGTVDAVRRQHQRDAYAAFLSAALVFSDQMNWSRCIELATAEATASTPTGRDEAARRLATGIRATVDIRRMQDAAVVVHLEGPRHISQLVMAVMDQARQNQKDAETAIRDTSAETGTLTLPDPTEADYAFSRRLSTFIAAASTHLNGGKALRVAAQVSAAAPVRLDGETTGPVSA